MSTEPWNEDAYLADQAMRRDHSYERARKAVDDIAGDDWPVLQLFYDACRAETWDKCLRCEWGWCDPWRLF